MCIIEYENFILNLNLFYDCYTRHFKTLCKNLEGDVKNIDWNHVFIGNGVHSPMAESFVAVCNMLVCLQKFAHNFNKCIKVKNFSHFI